MRRGGTEDGLCAAAEEAAGEERTRRRVGFRFLVCFHHRFREILEDSK